MPLALSLIPLDGQFDGNRSVMFVACNVCPRMHFAWELNEPVFSLAMLLGKKSSFVRYLTKLQQRASERGQRSAVFPAPSTSAACLWSHDLVERFRRAGADYEAFGVIGCESAVRTVTQVFSNRPVVQLARVKGIANFTLRMRWPLTVEIVAAAKVPCDMKLEEA